MSPEAEDPSVRPSADDDLRVEPIAPSETPAHPAWRRGRRGLVALGAGLMVVVGLGLVLARGGAGPAAPVDGTTLDVEVAALAPPPEPGPPEAPLDVLPDDMVAAAPVAQVPQAPVPEEEPPAAAAPSPAERGAARSSADSSGPEAVSADVADGGPSFDCRQARSRAERMVCADPRLAQADLRLDAAYRAALDAGVPAWRLERQQRRWLRAREDAAFEAPQAVAQVYEARIAELNDLAAPPPWPPSW